MSDAETLKRKRTTAKQQFTRKLNFFESLLNEKTSSDDEISQIFEEVTRAWNRVEDRHEAYAESLEETEYASSEAWIEAEQARYNASRKLYFSNKDSRGKSTAVKEKRFHMEKVSLPKFNGNIRSYPRFIKDFKSLVLPRILPEEYAYTLRQCLSDDVKAYLGNDDDISSMMKLLDMRYGDPGKLIESVIGEVHAFKRVDENDPRKLIHFVNVLDTGYRDLKNLGYEREICNAHVVCIIEGKLPHSLEIEWYRHIHKGSSPVDKLDKFPYLLEFLKVERAALEYGTSEMKRPLRQGNVNSLDSSHSIPRLPSNIGDQETGENSTRQSVINIVDSSSGLCLLHGTGNHDTTDCRKYGKMNVSDRYALLRSSSACFGCLRPNHQLGNCDRRVTEVYMRTGIPGKLSP